MTRVCCACRVEKPLDAVNFGVHARTTGGFRYECRPCRGIGRSALRSRDLEGARKREKKAADATRVTTTARRRARYAANDAGYRDTQIAYARSVPCEKRNANVRAWRARRPDAVKKHNAKRDPIAMSASALVRRHLRSSGGKKQGRTFADILGYSVADLRAHLETMFRDGMAWDNYGSLWELDHITPLRALPAASKTDENFRKAWALTNLQPLTVRENRSKGGRILELAA